MGIAFTAYTNILTSLIFSLLSIFPIFLIFPIRSSLTSSFSSSAVSLTRARYFFMPPRSSMSSPRVRISIFWKMWWTWLFTVGMEMKSREPISR